MDGGAEPISDARRTRVTRSVNMVWRPWLRGLASGQWYGLADPRYRTPAASART